MKRNFEFYLTANGDDRLTLEDSEGSNKYGCQPLPYTHLSYSSSTASTIYPDTFEYVKKYFMKNEHQLDDKQWVEKEYQKIRDHLRSYIGLEDNVDIALGASGTDLELLPILYFGEKEEIVNIVMAPEEVGGGIKHIGKAQHFSTKLSNEKKVSIGETIDGFESYNINYTPLPIRDESGEFIGNKGIEENIYNTVKKYYGHSKIILHMIYKSKTAIVSPSESFIEFIHQNYPDVLILVDACQYRTSPTSIKKFIELNAMVLLTGSKFFGAPPFCSAILIPSSLRNEFTQTKNVPIGLYDYFSRYEFPARWQMFDGVLEKRKNIGLLLRWNAAIYEMKNFALINEDRFFYTIKIFNQVFDEVQKEMNYFELEPVPELNTLSEVEKNFSLTLVTFTLDNDSFSYDDARVLYRQLLDIDNMPKEYQIACHIGQPVKVKRNAQGSWRASFRISLNARFFSKYSGEIFTSQHKQFTLDLKTIFRKLEFLMHKLKSE